ncbi:PUMP1 [Symbiodinium natans]|uniref:PUMP1 protein n=1 Tax=Symbiodinium natans TaxID=878477 RepID=A0A812IHQ0_9DINO|nr:PUMP1 [Symbiodinium natans]
MHKGALSACARPGHRVAAAAATGLGGSLCANGPDVVKVRLFAEPGRYPGFLSAATEIAQKEGFVRGLLVRGVSASAPRGAAIAIGEVTTYDQTKTTLRRHWPGIESAARDGRREPFSLHVVTSLITGVVATTVAAPFDTLKSCVMADDGTRFPRGFLDALLSIVRSEGPASLFRGWWPAYCRLGPHAILTFPLLEQVRKALGLQYL